MSWVSFYVILFFTSIYFLSTRVECRGGRILGGNLTQPGEIKYVVFMVWQDASGQCTGGILSKFWILTAAHCLIDKKTNDFKKGRLRVIAGTNQVRTKDSSTGIYLAKTIIIPHEYNANLDADIALLQLAEPLKGNLEKMKLPDIIDYASNFVPGKIFKFAGFGRTELVYYNNGSYKTVRSKDGVLRKADMVFDASCNKNPSHTFCAKMVNDEQSGPIGICNGDSGGPLVDDRKVLFGISSFGGSDCDQNTYAPVFTDVYHYVDFLRKVPNDLSAGRFKQANQTGYF